MTTATDRFVNLPPEKQERVREAAVEEFATRGFEHANTNAIARRAGVSVGALFKYFPTKEALFRYVVHHEATVIESRVGALLTSTGSTLDKLESIVRLVQETSRLQASEVRLYHEITAAGNRELVRHIAQELESYTAGAYATLIAQGQAAGEIRTDIDARMLAFLVDNLFVSLQFAYACDYFADRFHIYVGEEQATRDEEVVRQVVAFVRDAVRRPS